MLDVCASNMDSTNSMRLGRGYLFNRPMEGRGSVHKNQLIQCVRVRDVHLMTQADTIRISMHSQQYDTYEAGTDAIRFTSNKYLSKMYILLRIIVLLFDCSPPVYLIASPTPDSKMDVFA